MIEKKGREKEKTGHRRNPAPCSMQARKDFRQQKDDVIDKGKWKEKGGWEL